jgi:hypothetical protein
MGDLRVLILPYCSEKRRGAGFLEITGEKFVNAYSAYQNLRENYQNRLITSFRHWVTSITRDIPDMCHGYNKTDHSGKYVNCFQFELHDGRFYGFLSHPDDVRRDYFFFTAVHYLEKRYFKTDITVLDRINSISQEKSVRLAVRKPITVPFAGRTP